MANESVHEPVPADAENAAAQLVEAAFRVHRTLGPGLLESVYERCVCHELASMGVPFQSQVDVPVEYGGVQLGTGLRLDLLVDSRVVCELKAVAKVSEQLPGRVVGVPTGAVAVPRGGPAGRDVPGLRACKKRARA